MAIFATRPFANALLATPDDGTAHIFEPEFHQAVYTQPAIDAQKSPHGAFQLSDLSIVTRTPNRGLQPAYVDDLDSARSVSESFFQKNEKKSAVLDGDLLINSTGDGTIGRVAVYHHPYAAVVDGHVTIVRFHDVSLAWYTAAYLLTTEGQRQIYRYINGSSGQVEIYPQDISRLWIPRRASEEMISIGAALKLSSEAFTTFRNQMGQAIAGARYEPPAP